jgi:hypothetical protein
VGFRALAAVIAVLDILLGIVPGAAARVIEMATNRPETITPSSSAPSAAKPCSRPAMAAITK